MCTEGGAQSSAANWLDKGDELGAKGMPPNGQFPLLEANGRIAYEVAHKSAASWLCQEPGPSGGNARAG